MGINTIFGGKAMFCTVVEANNSPRDVSARRFRFRLVHLFYAITLLASALATFGAYGLLPAIVILFTWAMVFASPSRPQALWNAVAMFFLVGCGTLCLLPAVQTTRVSSPRIYCMNNVKQIALALHAYHATNGSFPPAYVADSAGKPMHSWRVLILPYLEEGRLYRSYNFKEPWNGPNNSKLGANIPQVYQCPTHARFAPPGAGLTSYFAVIGPGTVWPGVASTKLTDISDGAHQTLLLVERHGLGVNWLEPRDLTTAEAMTILSDQNAVHQGGHENSDFFFRDLDEGRNMAYADGHTHFLPAKLDESVAAALLSRADGNVLSATNLLGISYDHEPAPKYANWFRLAILVLITLLPLPWVWIHPRGLAQS